MGTYAAGETTGSGSVYRSIEMGSAYTPATDAAEPTGSKAMNFKLEGIRGEVLPPLLLLDQLYKVQWDLLLLKGSLGEPGTSVDKKDSLWSIYINNPQPIHTIDRG